MPKDIIRYLEDEHKKHKEIVDSKSIEMTKLFFDGKLIPREMQEIEKITYYKDNKGSKEPFSLKRNAYTLHAIVKKDSEPDFDEEDFDPKEEYKETLATIYKDKSGIDIIYNEENREEIRIHQSHDYKYIYVSIDSKNEGKYYMVAASSDTKDLMPLKVLYCSNENLEIIRKKKNNYENITIDDLQRYSNLTEEYYLGELYFDEIITEAKKFKISPIDYIENKCHKRKK